LTEARIALSMTGMLSAIPKTPLYDRLAAEGRLDPSDPPEFGTNVIPLRISRSELRDGYVKVMDDLYATEAYFDRLDALFIDGRLTVGRGRSRYWRTHPLNFLKWQSLWLVQSLGLYLRLMLGVPDPSLRREYRRRFLNMVRHRPDPGMWVYYLLKTAIHYHAHAMAREMAAGRALVNSF
jgi:hypothetical protein